MKKTRAAIELNISLRRSSIYTTGINSLIEKLCTQRRKECLVITSFLKIKRQVADLVSRELYAGFRPTFTCEKLALLPGFFAKGKV
jgi:hypothetical protein